MEKPYCKPAIHLDSFYLSETKWEEIL